MSPGVAFAPALVVRWAFPEIPERTISPAEFDTEVARLHQAVQAVVDQLAALRLRTLQRAGPEAAGIFDAQIMMVQDVDFLAGVESLIRKNLLSAESAYEFKALDLRNTWQNARQSFLRPIPRRFLPRLLIAGLDRGYRTAIRHVGDRAGDVVFAVEPIGRGCSQRHEDEAETSHVRMPTFYQITRHVP